MFSFILHVAGVEVVGQEKFAKNAQDSRETMTCPNIHQLLRA